MLLQVGSKRGTRRLCFSLGGDSRHRPAARGIPVVPFPQVIEQCRDDLLSGPHWFWFQDCGRQQFDLCVRPYQFQSRQTDQRRKHQLLVFPFVQEGVPFGQFDTGHDVVLDQSSQGCSVRRSDELQIGFGNVFRLGSTQIALWEMTIHFVTIVIGIVCVTIRVVHSDGLLRGVVQDTDLVAHNAGLVQRWLSVHEHHVPVPELPSHDRGLAALLGVGQQASGNGLALVVVHLGQIDAPVREFDPPGTGVLEGPALHQVSHLSNVDVRYGGGVRKGLGEIPRESNLVGSNVRVGRNDGTAGVVDAFSHHVLSEDSLLPLEQLPDADGWIGIGRRVLRRIDEAVEMGLQLDPGGVGLRFVLGGKVVPQRLVGLEDAVEVSVLDVLDRHAAQLHGRSKPVGGNRDGLNKKDFRALHGKDVIAEHRVGGPRPSHLGLYLRRVHEFVLGGVDLGLRVALALVVVIVTIGVFFLVLVFVLILAVAVLLGGIEFLRFVTIHRFVTIATAIAVGFHHGRSQSNSLRSIGTLGREREGRLENFVAGILSDLGRVGSAVRTEFRGLAGGDDLLDQLAAQLVLKDGIGRLGFWLFAPSSPALVIVIVAVAPVVLVLDLLQECVDRHPGVVQGEGLLGRRASSSLLDFPHPGRH
mmetsp:Transcript_26267/g.72152  ORF Transcript_26267/g.72152 Transcript_26267/m.72152 type:complete len:642 (-) Transcript_26267:797-2722(-)